MLSSVCAEHLSLLWVRAMLTGFGVLVYGERRRRSLEEKFKSDKEFDHAFFNSRRQCDYPGCPFCARLFLTWLKLRMGQMAVARTKLGETVSFAEAASTSNVPDKENQ